MGNPYIVAARKYGAPYELGITRMAVLRRDDWTCKMEACLYGDRTIKPDVPGHVDGRIPDQRGSVDHIIPLREPNTPGHVWTNVRAAHRLCNREAINPASKPPLVRLIDIADILGVTTQRANQIAAGSSFPEPAARDHRGPLWDRREVRAWRADQALAAEAPMRQTRASDGGEVVDGAVQVVQSLIRNAIRMADEAPGLGEPGPGSEAAQELEQQPGLVDDWTEKPVYDCYWLASVRLGTSVDYLRGLSSKRALRGLLEWAISMNEAIASSANPDRAKDELERISRSCAKRGLVFKRDKYGRPLSPFETLGRVLPISCNSIRPSLSRQEVFREVTRNNYSCTPLAGPWADRAPFFLDRHVSDLGGVSQD